MKMLKLNIRALRIAIVLTWSLYIMRHQDIVRVSDESKNYIRLLRDLIEKSRVENKSEMRYLKEVIKSDIRHLQEEINEKITDLKQESKNLQEKVEEIKIQMTRPAPRNPAKNPSSHASVNG